VYGKEELGVVDSPHQPVDAERSACIDDALIDNVAK
jgi:hypothetical protein